MGDMCNPLLLDAMKVYLSGPVTGIDRDECIERFRKAEELLEADGFKVVNPMRTMMGRWPWLYKLVGYRLTLLYDLWLLMGCDRIYKMPGWKESKGANVESCVAFHFGAYTLPVKMREDYDKRISKHMEKWRQRGLPSPTDTLSRKKNLNEHSKTPSL